jgi:hypothetical protein
MKADKWLEEMAKGFRDADRLGADVDTPEGSRTVVVSDTLADKLAVNLERIANALRGQGIEIELGE